MGNPEFPAPIAEQIWNLKYRLRAPGHAPEGRQDHSFDDTAWRVARAAAQPEAADQRERWAAAFHAAIADFGFLPAGRILAGAGTDRAVTLFNCFVMGRIEDDLGSIFDNVKEAALTMQQGGGIGHDFSTLRPKGAPVRSIGADASGPVSFMDVWDSMCRTIMSAGARRGAMMGTMRCDHPDIEAFVAVKSDPGRLRNFNLSVLVTDAFMAAVEVDGPWELVFEGQVYRTVRARALWDQIMRATYDYAEPGVIFIDRVNARNNLAYCEEIRATNPCGEQPLPPYGACLLGSLNLTRFVQRPFAEDARLNVASLVARARVAVRLLDNVIEISNYPLAAQRHEAHAKRRIGLGVTGLANALAMVGVRYGSAEAAALAGSWMAAIQSAAYEASAGLAAEKGPFPLYEREPFLAAPNVAALPEKVRASIAANGIRNGCLTSIAPTGTISLLAGNVSSGIEPMFDYAYTRRILEADGRAREERIEDYAFADWRRASGEAPLPAAFVRAHELSPGEHLAMQAALQPHVDSSISKTINCPPEIAFASFKDVYADAYRLGLKGCTTYRPNEVTGAVLSADGGGGVAAPSVGASATMAISVSAEERAADVVYMTKPLERDGVLAGYTYKLKWPESDHAIYVTINDIEHAGGPGQPKRRRPFEIFINTRNLEHYAWTVALTRMISAVFRRGGDVSFVADELKGVFDPQGGRWMGGRYVPSLLAAIGEVIEGHMIRTGFLSPTEGAVLGAGTATGAGEVRRVVGKHCPRCASASYVREAGCWICRSCGFARCE